MTEGKYDSFALPNLINFSSELVNYPTFKGGKGLLNLVRAEVILKGQSGWAGQLIRVSVG